MKKLLLAAGLLFSNVSAVGHVLDIINQLQGIQYTHDGENVQAYCTQALFKGAWKGWIFGLIACCAQTIGGAKEEPTPITGEGAKFWPEVVRCIKYSFAVGLCNGSISAAERCRMGLLAFALAIPEDIGGLGGIVGVGWAVLESLIVGLMEGLVEGWEISLCIAGFKILQRAVYNLGYSIRCASLITDTTAACVIISLIRACWLKAGCPAVMWNFAKMTIG